MGEKTRVDEDESEGWKLQKQGAREMPYQSKYRSGMVFDGKERIFHRNSLHQMFHI